MWPQTNKDSSFVHLTTVPISYCIFFDIVFLPGDALHQTWVTPIIAVGKRNRTTGPNPTRHVLHGLLPRYQLLLTLAADHQEPRPISVLTDWCWWYRLLLWKVWFDREIGALLVTRLVGDFCHQTMRRRCCLRVLDQTKRRPNHLVHVGKVSEVVLDFGSSQAREPDIDECNNETILISYWLILFESFWRNHIPSPKSCDEIDAFYIHSVS